MWEKRCNRLCCCFAGRDHQYLSAVSDISEVLSAWFHDADVVASDIAVGLILLQQQQEQMQAEERSQPGEVRNYWSYPLEFWCDLYTASISLIWRELNNEASSVVIELLHWFPNFLFPLQSISTKGTPVNFNEPVSPAFCKSCWQQLKPAWRLLFFFLIFPPASYISGAG